jgi:hypothetical protein
VSGVGGLPPQFEAYAELFNRGEFFEAHEVLEGLWWERDCDPFWQGLIIFAAAFEKVRRRSATGARKHFEAALRYLEPLAPGREGIDIRPVLAHARRCLEMLGAGRPLEEIPSFHMPPGELVAEAEVREASDEEIRRVVEDVLRGTRRLPSVLKEALLRLGGRAGRSRVEPVVRNLVGRKGPRSPKPR